MKHVHFIGIGGSGLSAIARLLLEKGYTVSGSDRVRSPLAQELAKAGVTIYDDHQAQNIGDADLVIRSSAVPDDNPEVKAALAAGIPVLKRSDFLQTLMEGKRGIAISGTHGKTTTTAMIALLLARLGQDPSYIIGSVAKDLGRNARYGQGQFFVIEADEYDRMFLGLRAELMVVTNMEHDHPDCYPTPADYRAAFVELVNHLEPNGLLLACADDPGAAGLTAEIRSDCRALSYGTHPAADYVARNLRLNELGGLTFEAACREGGSLRDLATVSLRLPGEHNVRNALAALAAAHQLGLPAAEASLALQAYSGAERRFEILGEAQGITIIDDYAHHPTEIRATLAAARSRFANRQLWVVWQPHTFSRTQTLLDAFLHAFADADQVLVTEVYAAREQNATFSARQIVQRMPHPSARFTPALVDAIDFLLKNLRSGDVLLVLSAGDANRISSAVLAALNNKENVNAC